MSETDTRACVRECDHDWRLYDNDAIFNRYECQTCSAQKEVFRNDE